MSSSILSKVLDYKKLEIAELKKRFSRSELETLAAEASPPRDFSSSLLRGVQPRIIAEIKKASPSKGVIAENFDPVLTAKQYQQNGAAALSVLTDENFFQGSLSNMQKAKREVSVPVLRKDFLVDPHQIYESRAHGADAVLLIVAAMESTSRLSELLSVSRSLGMEPLVEVHKESEVEMALDAQSLVIGINNRDLESFEVDLSVSKRLAPLINKDKVIVSESGITSSSEMVVLSEYGINAFLVGEGLMMSSNPGKALSAIIQGWAK